MTRNLLPFLLLFVSLLTSCASPPVWRTKDYGPAQPAPTLLAAACYDFGSNESAIDLNSAFNTARQVATAITGIKAVEATADQMHQKATAYLQAQGFQLETDGARSKKITEAGMVGGQFTRVIEPTAPRPFGQFMLFGPGSKGSIAERLATDRAREAYASVYAGFRSPGGSLENGVTCTLWIQVLDKNGVLVFEGKTQGQAPFRKAPGEVVLDAFGQALAAMQTVVVKE